MPQIRTEGEFTATITSARVVQNERFGGLELELQIRDARGDSGYCSVSLSDEKAAESLDKIRDELQHVLTADAEQSELVGRMATFSGRSKEKDGKVYHNIYLGAGKKKPAATLSMMDKLAALAKQRAVESGKPVTPPAKAAQTVEDDSVPF